MKSDKKQMHSMFYIELLKKLSCCMYSFLQRECDLFLQQSFTKMTKVEIVEIVTERQTIKHKQN